MSNHLAIATVTAALQRSLQAALVADDLGATATMVRPDASNAGQLPDPGVNLFLYQVTPNSAWSNMDLPTRDAAGQPMQRPRIALDLHYLFTFHGDETVLFPQRVLGSVVRAMHERPVLARDAIEAAVAENAFLAGSNLAEEIEQVKFTSEPFDLEELSKLWSVMFQTTYALSTTYLGTVVLIEGEEAPRRVLPVRVRQISALPFRKAFVERIEAQAGRDAPISEGDTALLRGRQLGGDIAGVRVGEALLAPAAIGGAEVRVVLSHVALRAGVQGVRIEYASGAASNLVGVVLRPRIDSVVPAQIDADGDGIDDTPVLRATLSATVGPRQSVLMYLNGLEPAPGPGTSYNLTALPREADSDTVLFAIDTVAAGDYLVRVEVGGAESVLTFDAVTGVFNGPTVTVA